MQQPVLIPRVESEKIIDIALKLLNNLQNASFLEIGSGSGVLSISLVKEAPKNMKIAGLSIDIM